jgi:hypothetical protein
MNEASFAFDLKRIQNPMRLFRFTVLIFSVAFLTPQPALAYIDPGTVSMVIQGLFAIIFGAATAWVMRPWHIVKSLFRRRKPEPLPRQPDAAKQRSDGDQAAKP